MHNLFFISGLGADRRVFNNIQLTGYHITYVDWIEPAIADTIVSYASKLIAKYHIKSGDIVVGVSLGGIIAIEINKQIGLKKAILISSLKNTDEAPAYFGLFRLLPVYKLIPATLLTSLGSIMAPIFGPMDKEGKKLFVTMLKDSSPAFMKWAMGAVLNWHSTTHFTNVYEIIGDKDLIFDAKKVTAATIVKGGTHIMIFNRSKEINAWLIEVLAK